MFLVVAALEEELHSLRIYLSQKKSFTKTQVNHVLQNSLEIYTCKNKHIGLLVSGVGKVLSSVSVSIACALYDVTHVLCVGCVLGIDSLCKNKNMEFGDIVCVGSAVEHDVDYSPFLAQSVLVCNRDNLYNTVCVAARKNTNDNNVYVDALLLTGDVYVNANKPLPQKIINVKNIFSQKHSCVVLDMEIAAICKSVQNCFNVEFAAVVIVLDSLVKKTQKKINFRKDIKIISEKIAHITKDVISNTISEKI